MALLPTSRLRLACFAETNAPMMSRAAERVCAERGEDAEEGRRSRPRRPWRSRRLSARMCAGAKLPSSFCSELRRSRGCAQCCC